MKAPSKSERIQAFHARLSELGYRNYREYLSGEHWRGVRARYWASKLGKRKCCSGCGSSSDLALHHRTYKRIGAERLSDLVQVCRGCHANIHSFEDRVSVHPWTATNKVVRKARKGIRLS